MLNWVRSTSVTLAILTTACTIKETPAPALTGPSEFATSVTLAVVPDLLTRDGFSQSTIVVTARDPQGAPLRSLQLRLDMLVNNVVQDFGSLSARTLITNADGRATAVYTAPPAPAVGASIITDRITVVVTPVGSNAQGATYTSADIRLVVPTVVDPNAPVAVFNYTPAAPKVGETIIFNGGASYVVPPASFITAYTWDWGDGGQLRTQTNGMEDQEYLAPGTYYPTLTVTDNLGRRGSTTRALVVVP